MASLTAQAGHRTQLGANEPDSGPEYLPAADFKRFKASLGAFPCHLKREICAAAEYAAVAHKGQFRANMEPFIVHPMEVARIVAGWRMDSKAVIAALLHDVLEDTDIGLDDLQTRFGEQIATLVNGATKIEKIENITAGDRQAESFRKMLLAVSQDWRVILIKLADRLHNMRTLGNLAPDKRKRIARETLSIYAPIAERLALLSVREELQTLSFKFIHPLRHAVLCETLKRSKKMRRKALPRIKKEITAAFAEAAIAAKLESRSKNIFSIYHKMREKRLPFREVDDLIGFRLIVDDRQACYQALGLLHEKFRPVPFKVKDYIGLPKANGYRSLHTTVVDRLGLIMEIQIRTLEMHEFADHGLAAHWNYKDTARPADEPARKHAMQDRTNELLRSLTTVREKCDRPAEFLQNLTVDLFPNDIYVLTPKGKIVHLPRGATALDFAYAIHTDLGDSAKTVLIEGRTMPVSAKLKNGDMVTILRSATTNAPQAQWLNFVVSAKARAHIRSVMRSQWSKELAELGRKLLERSLTRHGTSIGKVEIKTWGNFFKRYRSFKSKEELYSQIALGKIAAEIISIELASSKKDRPTAKEKPVTIIGSNRAGVTMAECCQPLPPEPIFGVMQPGKGVIVHHSNCRTGLRTVAPEKRIVMFWDMSSPDLLFNIHLRLECANQHGLFAAVITALRHDDINVANVNLTGGEKGNPVTVIDITVQAGNTRQSEMMMRHLGAIPGVMTVSRAGATSVRV